MIPCSPPRPAPTGSRYWCATLPGVAELAGASPIGPHWFRFPTYAEGHALRAALATKAKTDGTPATEVEMIEQLPLWAAVVGWCWHPVTQHLETPKPVVKAGTAPSTEALYTYGALVADELQEANYTLVDILLLFNASAPEIRDRLSVGSQAVLRAGFSPPPGDSGTTSP